MLIRFLKKHISWKAGDEANVVTTEGNYLIRCHVAEPVDADPKKTEAILLSHLVVNKEVAYEPELSEEEFEDTLLTDDILDSATLFGEVDKGGETKTLVTTPASVTTIKKSRKKIKPE